MSADSGNVEPSQMKIGLVVGEPLSRAELEAAYGGFQNMQEVEFVNEDEDDEAPAPCASSPTKSPGRS